MEKEIVEFLNEVMDCNEVPRRLRLWALQIKTSPEKPCACTVEETTGWTIVKCCNICGKPLKSENWHS